MVHLESNSLSRLVRINNKHHCASITAFRAFDDHCGYDDGDPICVSPFGSKLDEDECENPKRLTRNENKKRNLALAQDLSVLKFNIVKVIGKYPEGGKIKTEVSFFCWKPGLSLSKLEDIMKNLGLKYEQDAVLIIPRGAMVKGRAYLLSTNHCPNNWVGEFGNKVNTKIGAHFGTNNEYYESRVGGRPFHFDLESSKIEDYVVGSLGNAMVAKRVSKYLDDRMKKRLNCDK